VEGGVQLNKQHEVAEIPGAVWLFGSGLLGMIGIARHRNPQLG